MEEIKLGNESQTQLRYGPTFKTSFYFVRWHEESSNTSRDQSVHVISS